MLFSREPKTRIGEFYDREKELEMFFKGIDAGEGLIVVYGVRRIGKTSFVYVGLSELNIPFIPLDLRKYSENPILLTPSAIAYVVDDVLKEYDLPGKLWKTGEKILEYIKSVEIPPFKLKPSRGRKKLLVNVLEKANKWAKRKETRIAIVLDEAQELRTVPAWRNILAWAVDTLENVSFIVTGSEVGVLNDFLKLSDPKSPLFGRARLEIKLERFSREQSIGFLLKGFEEANIRVSRGEIEEVADKLDGIVGWLSLYGYYRVTYGLSHVETLKRLEEEAEELLSSELEKLVKYSPRRYTAILWAISLGLNSWSTIKHFAEGIVGHIPDSKFNKLLQNLVKYGFIEKTENLKYKIADPLLSKAVKKLRRKHRVCIKEK